MSLLPVIRIHGGEAVPRGGIGGSPAPDGTAIVREGEYRSDPTAP
jgi:hypothetical protein